MLTHLCLLCKQIEMKQTVVSSPPDAEPSQRDKAYQALRRLLILQQVQEGEQLVLGLDRTQKLSVLGLE